MRLPINDVLDIIELDSDFVQKDTGYTCCRENCGKPAVWIYMPASDDMDYCDEHVPRGCSCNDEQLDTLGREYPCCEFTYIGDDEL